MARVYRNVSSPVTIGGLELADVAVLLAFFVFIFNLSDHIFVNAATLAGVYFALRLSKRGRPPGFVLDLAAFLLSSPLRDASLDDDLIGYPKRDAGHAR